MAQLVIPPLAYQPHTPPGKAADLGVCTVILFVYIDSYLFVASTTILQVGVGLADNFSSCE